jgi:hypothetical protein
MVNVKKDRDVLVTLILGIEPTPKSRNGQNLNFFESQKMISDNFGYPLQDSARDKASS